MGIVMFAMYVVIAVTVQGATGEVQGVSLKQSNQEYHAQKGTNDYKNLNQ